MAVLQHYKVSIFLRYLGVLDLVVSDDCVRSRRNLRERSMCYSVPWAIQLQRSAISVSNVTIIHGDSPKLNKVYITKLGEYVWR